MSTIVAFPSGDRMRVKAPRTLQFEADDQKFRKWYRSLPVVGLTARYSLHELRSYTGIPMTRLVDVLRRLQWSRHRDPSSGVQLWSWACEEIEDDF